MPVPPSPHLSSVVLKALGMQGRCVGSQVSWRGHFLACFCWDFDLIAPAYPKLISCCPNNSQPGAKQQQHCSDWKDQRRLAWDLKRPRGSELATAKQVRIQGETACLATVGTSEVKLSHNKWLLRNKTSRMCDMAMLLTTRIAQG